MTHHYIIDGRGIENGRQVPIVEPAFADEPEAQDMAEAKELSAWILREVGNICLARINEGEIGRKFFVAMHALGHPLTQGKAICAQADELHATKYALTKLAKSVSAKLGLIPPWQRGGLERLRMSEAAFKRKKPERVFKPQPAKTVHQTITKGKL